MQLHKTTYNPYVTDKDRTSVVMMDVVIALIPCVFMSFLAYRYYPMMVILTAVGSAMLAEYLFSYIFLKRTDSLADGSAIVTGILMAFTVGPFTPLYVVAFGGATAVIFGKMLFGGLGRNRFNPALVGREFMTIFFPVIMSSGAIWQEQSLLYVDDIHIVGNGFFDGLFYNVSGAIGEYSPFFLVLGGLFLLLRRRITWHIPFAMFVAFGILLFLFADNMAIFSFGGLFLGGIYMATDMPTSSSNKVGKLYYGAMIGIICVLCLSNGADKGYFSYSILIMNGFVEPVNSICRPRVFGENINIWKRSGQLALLTLAIFAVTVVVIVLDNYDAIMYPVLFFVAYTIIRFIMFDMKGEKQQQRLH